VKPGDYVVYRPEKCWDGRDRTAHMGDDARRRVGRPARVVRVRYTDAGAPCGVVVAFGDGLPESDLAYYPRAFDPLPFDPQDPT
jgi:hypothetical protein